MTVSVIQARMGATRLPGKVLRPLGERSVLSWVVRAAQSARLRGRVIVATSVNPADDAVASEAWECGAEVVRGSEHDVLSRFVQSVEGEADRTAVVRLTADNPLVDPGLIQACARAFGFLDVDYLSTAMRRSLPHGLDVEVASVGALRRAGREAVGVDRAHVTSYLYRQPGRFRVAGLTFSPPADDLRLTLDTSEDAAAIEAVVDELGDRPPSRHEVIDLLRRRPDIAQLNADIRQKRLDEG